MLHCSAEKIAALRPFSSPARCPHCGDWLVAPVHSEFVVGGEIRHYWECDTCGQASVSAIPPCDS